MGFQISPGVQFSETDLTGIVPVSSTTDGAYAGEFVWGPAEVPVLVTNESDVLNTFGKPPRQKDNAEASYSFFTCANFLSYGDKLRVVRTVDTTTHVAHVLNIESIDEGAQKITFVEDLTEVSPAIKRRDSISLEDILPGTEDLVILDVEGTNTVQVHYANVIPQALVDLVNDLPAGETLALTVKSYAGALNASADQLGCLILNDQHYEDHFSRGESRVGAWVAKCAGEKGNSLRVALCASASAFQSEIPGTLSTDSTVTDGDVLKLDSSGSADLEAHLVPGSVVVNKRTLESRIVTQVISASKIQVDAPFSAALDEATLIAKWEFADLFSTPGTSSDAAKRGARNDEVHIVVVDDQGKFTGFPGSILERFEGLSKSANAKLEDGTNNYYASVINASSAYVYWTDHLTDAGEFADLVLIGSNWGTNLAAAVQFISPSRPSSVALFGGADGNSSEGARLRGYDKFKDSDAVDVSLVVTGNGSSTVCNHVIQEICEKRLDCVAFCSPPLSAVKSNPNKELDSIVAFRNRLPSTSYAVLDTGWKVQFDKYNDETVNVPLNGDIAGLCVATDTSQDPWWSPAGYARGSIKNVEKLHYNPAKPHRDILYKNNVNPVISQPGEGTILFGDKTLLTKPSAFDRINVRRLFIVLEKNISRMSKYMLFEFNDEFTRQQFRSMVEPFLRDIQSRRGLYDFKVVCDRTNNTPEVIDRNEFVGDIYIKPARSINFIQLNFIAVRTGVEFSEIVGRV